MGRLLLSKVPPPLETSSLQVRIPHLPNGVGSRVPCTVGGFFNLMFTAYYVVAYISRISYAYHTHIMIRNCCLICIVCRLLTGQINSYGHVLPVDCQPPAAALLGSAASLALTAQQSAIPSLLLRFDIGACIAGTSADNLTSTQCLPCEPRSFNFDGLGCAGCPFGTYVQC